MGRFGAAATVLLLAGAMPVRADDFPNRKAGLWEVTSGAEDPGSAAPATQQCVDAATDRTVGLVMEPWAYLLCARREVRRAGDTMTADATCKMVPDKPERGGTIHTVTVHAVVNGNFDSAYTMTMTVQGKALPGGTKTITTAAKWLGPCAAGQKPGDIVMGGLKMNILEMMKRGRSQGVPLPR